MTVTANIGAARSASATGAWASIACSTLRCSPIPTRSTTGSAPRSRYYWDAVLHAWVVTRYPDVVTVLQRCSAARTPDPDHLATMGLEAFNPIAQVLKRQMIFMDPPDHTRIRRLAASAFTPHRVETLRQHIQEITDSRIAAVRASGRMDVVADLAVPLPATVICRVAGHARRRSGATASTGRATSPKCSATSNTTRIASRRRSRRRQELTGYFREKMHGCPYHLNDGLVTGLMAAEEQGDKLSEDDIIANSMLTMSGGQETTSILIGNSVLTLLRNPDQLRMLHADPP